MYDILKFIDSPDVREYHKDSRFTPAQECVLIAVSQKTTVEEKIETLRYILNHYKKEELGVETVSENDPFEILDADQFLMEANLTLHIWEELLRMRYDNSEKGVIYAANLTEKGFFADRLTNYCFFSSYDAAYHFLLRQKQEYLSDADLKDVETYGTIYRITLDNQEYNHTDADEYRFDSEMRLVQVFGSMKWKPVEVEEDEMIFTLESYGFYLPLPFQKGDIVKAESPFYETYYGVIPYGSDEKSEELRKKNKTLYRSLDVYDKSSGCFYFTDDSNVLQLSLCNEEELPKEQEILKQVGEVRKGNMDFISFLSMSGAEVRRPTRE